MYKKRKIRYFSLLILILGFCYGACHTTGKNEDCGSSPISFIHDYLEIESRFLIDDKNEIYFTATEGDSFSLYKLKDAIVSVQDTNKNLMNPFLFKGEVFCLQDKDGDEKFISTSSVLNEMLEFSYIQSIFSFKNGFLLVIQLKNDTNLYLFDLTSNTKSILIRGVNSLHSIVYSSTNNFMVANYNDKLSHINLNNNNHEITLASNYLGNKMNPYLYDNEVYFANNNNSEYFQIYRINLKEESKSPTLVHKTNYDIKTPKFDGENLYYIEIIQGEYVLRKKEVNTGFVLEITKKGVIYNYELWDGNILFSYADFNTPKSLVTYNETSDSFTNLTGSSLGLNISYSLIEQTETKSPAYLYTPNDQASIKGIILFFRPGLHADFSPRWDAVLMNLCNNGYIIISPNYPMSSGFGKTYYKASLSNAVTDIQEWTDYITENYKDLNLYFLSSSSGNILMEQSLVGKNKKIRASASLFGIPSTNIPNPPIPNLYILGENDPVVNFQIQMDGFNSSQNKNIRTVSYKDEGHWFRESKNLGNAVQEIENHFCLASKKSKAKKLLNR
jgi:dipeptidyl aminopeptidase/acylaminoacyl peptidase